MSKKRIWFCGFALLFAACGEVPSETAVAQIGLEEDGLTLPGWCYEPVPPPPGPCRVEVVMENTTVVSGQGISEGKLELEITGSTSNGGSTDWPGAGHEPRKVKNGKTKTIAQIVGTYELGPNEVRQIEVCASVTEVDNGGLNGQSDTGEGCDLVTISCNMFPQTSAITTPLCMGGNWDANGVCLSNLNGSVRTEFSIRSEDLDGDGIPNMEDFAPEPCDDHPAVLGQGGRALIVYFEMQDNYSTTLVQELGVNLDKAMEGYDYIVLLKQDIEFAGIQLSAAAINHADLWLDPTIDNFFFAMRDVVSKHFDFDLMLFSHGSPIEDINLTDISASFVAMDGEIDGEMIRDALHPSASGVRTIPLRMAHTIACYHDVLVPLWLSVGGKAATGPFTLNFQPNNQPNFTDAWNNLQTFGAAVAGASTPANRTVSHLFIEAQGLLDGCNVLGSDPCVEDWFTGTGAYNLAEDFDPTLSGQVNMNLASTQMPGGDLTVTKYNPQVW